jgi:Trk K+ transport system NAD-binding subunit
VPGLPAATRLVADLRYLRALLRQFRPTFLLALALFGVVPLLYVWGWRGPQDQRVGWGAAAHHVYFLLFGNPSLPYTDSVAMEALNVLVPLFGVAVLADGVVRFGHLFFAKRGHAREWIAVRTQGMDQHVIVVGAGRVGYRVTAQLRALGREVVVLEKSADAPLAAALREEGVPVLQEDARTPGALGRCNVARASAVVCSTDDDLVNLNVALDARRENPGIRVVLRVFDDDLAQKVRDGFGAEALSASGLAAPALAIAALDPRVRHSFQSGAHLFVVSEFRAAEGLSRLTVAELRDRFGALTLSIDRSGATHPHPPGDTRVEPGDRLLVQALWPDYQRLRAYEGAPAAPAAP